MAGGHGIPGGGPQLLIQAFLQRDSNPVFVGAPKAGHTDGDNPGYSAFATRFKDRRPVVYVGANDGMLHGFDVSVTAATNLPTADAGKEVLAYVPSPVYGNLSQLTDRG